MTHHLLFFTNVIRTLFLLVLYIGCNTTEKIPGTTNLHRYPAPTPTPSPPTFTALANISSSEGQTVQTAAFACVDSTGTAATYYGIKTETNSNSNCTITSAPQKLSCPLAYLVGHLDWTSTVKVSCEVNGSLTDTSVTITVTDTNRAPDLSSISNQSVYIQEAITSINTSDGSDDLDADQDSLTYSCTFSGGGYAAGSVCTTSLPAVSTSFNTATGVFTWTPSDSAVTAGTNTVYTFTITASDGQTAPLTDTSAFTVTVQTIAAPTFSSTNPASPSNSSTTPLVIGSSSSDTATVTIYTDASCTTSIGSGTKATFEGAGIPISVTANATTSIYAKAFDNAGHSSQCTSMTTYTHDNSPPTAPTFISISPTSPSNTSTSPAVVGQASGDTATVTLYSDSSCASSIGTNTKTIFETTGTTATVTANTSTTIYAKAFDSLSNASTCASMTSYTHDNVAPSNPTYTATNPTTPSGSSTTPLVSGGASADTSTLTLYSNAGCTTQIGSGSRTNYVGAGLTASITANATTTIYATAVDSASNASACTSLVSFVHDTIGPTDPAYSSTNPASPSSSSTTPKVIGTASADTITVKIYSDSLCGSLLASNTRATFVGTGITITVTANTTTSIYAKAFDTVGNASNCTAMTTYTHDNTAPSAPTYSSTNPSSPSAVSAAPFVIGVASSDTSTVKLYSDVSCASQVGTGTKADFVDGGIQATLTSNTTNSIYAKAFDTLTNASACTSMTSYIHDNVAPADPTFSSTDPTSPGNSTTTPTVIGSASADTSTLNFYSNASCTTEIGSGSKATFEAAGISVNVSANATTAIYVKAYDSAGNVTSCLLLTSFVHDNTAPSNPSYAGISPSSPSNSSNTPAVTGSSSGDTVTVKLFSDGACSSQIGTDTKANFEGAGVTATLSTNATTTIYGKAYDLANNGSGCISFTSYTHDNTAPSNIASLSDSTTYTTSTTDSPTLTWTATTETGSGLLRYQISIGTSAGNTDVLTWTSVGLVLTTTPGGLSLSSGTTYYANVRAIDNASNTSNVTSSNGWTVDTSAASTPVASANGCTPTTFDGSWSASTDNQSGVDHYEYSLGTTSGAQDVVAYTSNGTTTSISLSSLSLNAFDTYFLNVKTINGAGLTSAVSTGSVACSALRYKLAGYWSEQELVKVSTLLSATEPITIWMRIEALAPITAVPREQHAKKWQRHLPLLMGQKQQALSIHYDSELGAGLTLPWSQQQVPLWQPSQDRNKTITEKEHHLLLELNPHKSLLSSTLNSLGTQWHLLQSQDKHLKFSLEAISQWQNEGDSFFIKEVSIWNRDLSDYEKKLLRSPENFSQLLFDEM